MKLIIKKQKWKFNDIKFSNQFESFIESNPPVTGDDWNEDIYANIKKQILTILRPLQNNTCAYCRLPLNPGRSYSEIEHIVFKGTYYWFMFELKNLTLSCRVCNSKKSIKNVLKNPQIIATSSYPSTRKAFKIIHPHFDYYFRHIYSFDKVQYYKARTKKGEFTIECCKLDRLFLVEELQTELIYKNSPIMEMMRNFEKNPTEKNMGKLIKQMKKKITT